MRLVRRSLLAAALLPAAARAQGFPSRAVTLVVSFPPGGTVDAVGRKLAEPLAQALGQPVIIENRAGAGGLVAGSALSHAAPDGHTLMITTYATLSIAAAAGTRLDYDPLK